MNRKSYQKNLQSIIFLFNFTQDILRAGVGTMNFFGGTGRDRDEKNFFFGGTGRDRDEKIFFSFFYYLIQFIFESLRVVWTLPKLDFFNKNSCPKIICIYR